ncbi:site-specific integrase, partial [bacterium]|nr:site-specific integrase [bacterium]
MNTTGSIQAYKLYLKRRNYSDHTVKNYLHRLKQFLEWLEIPAKKVTSLTVKYYIDFLLEKQLEAHSINSHISSIRGFYDFLINDEQARFINPVVTGLALREPHPLPRHLKDVD